MEERFQKLREMEAFTDELFNRIFAFQEKTSAAWDESKPFDERIKGIPLHNLIFSNPDRDPKTTGPTVAHYYPLREENRALAYYAKQVCDEPTVLDVHGRNGFIGSLLAREGVKVIGMQNPDEKPNQIASFYDACYALHKGKLSDVDFSVDVAFCSWMPSGQNVTPEIIALKPKMIIYVYTEHVNEYSKLRQTGTDEAFDASLPDNYRIIDEWEIGRPENMLQEAWPDLSESIEETRIVRIYIDKSVKDIPQYAIETPATPYDWEQDLEFALLTIEAKTHLRARGVTV